MNQASPVAEIDAAVLQAVVTMGLTAVAAFLYQRYRKPYFAWFTVAFGLYVLRLGVIMAFLVTQAWAWLYWHQVATGWTALALLWAAQLFSRPRPWKHVYAVALVFPVAWSYAAIYVLDNFLWAALPAVVFLSIVTAWTGAVFLAHWRRTRMTGAAVLGVSFVLWALHHLDYPFLRARGALVPWGYYIDIAFLLFVGAGLLILVLDDQRGGLRAMMALADPARAKNAVSDMHQLLQRAATLPAATGAAIFSATEGALATQAIGVCSSWTSEPVPVGLRELLRDVLASDRPVVRTASGDKGATGDGATAYRAALPIPRETGDRQILVVVGEARHPFSALDDEVLVALGRQLGSALDGAELNTRLKARTVELSHLSKRMIQQHEEERRRLSLELHDETAQVFSAVKLKLGVIGEQVDAEAARSIASVAQLVDQGMQSIRSVTEMLRPAALDDLGLEAALRSLALEFEESTGIEVHLTTHGDTHSIEADAELALFRAMQEGLSNVARHANARRVSASLTMDAGRAVLVLSDDGVASPAAVDIDRLQRNGHMGLAGIRERAESLGGRFGVERGAHGGLQITLEIPARPGASA